MNAPVTPAATPAGGSRTQDTRTAAEASGFQALFATASQDASGGAEVSEAGGKDPEGGRATPKKPSDDDTKDILGALAAFLVTPLAVVTPCQGVASGSEGAGAGAAAGSAVNGASSTAGKAGLLQGSEDAASASVTTSATDEKPFLGLPGVSSPAVEVRESAEKAADELVAKPIADEAPAAANVFPPRPTDRFTGKPPIAAARAETEASRTASLDQNHGWRERHARSATSPEVASEVAGSAAEMGPPVGVMPQAPTGSGEAARGAAASSQASPMPNPDGGQMAAVKVTAVPGIPTGADEAKAKAAGSAQPSLAVDSAAEKADRQGRAKSVVDPGTDIPEGDDFSVAVQNSPSSQATAPVMNQGVASAAPHSSSPSAPALEHRGIPEPARAESNPAPAAPALQTAQVLQRMDRAEIRIGLQSPDFGVIRLHTTVANDQVGAVVSTSHAGLRDALLVEAPFLERVFARHSLRLDTLNVAAGTGAANPNSNSFGSNEQRHNPGAPANARLSTWTAARAVRSQSAASPAPAEERYRLDVRA